MLLAANVPGLAHARATVVGAAGLPDLYQRAMPMVPLADAGPSRDSIIDGLQRRYNARVLRVEEADENGRHVYLIRLLSGERVWTVRVDARTGRELPGG